MELLWTPYQGKISFFIICKISFSIVFIACSHKHHTIFSTLAEVFLLNFFVRYIYFTVTGVSPRILRADMDGKNLLVLTNVSSIRGTTLDITLDRVNNRLYYSDEGNNLVKYINLTSRIHQAVLYGNPRRPVGLTLFNGTLYWTGEGTVDPFSGGIYKVQTDTLNGGIVREVVDLLSYPKGIYAHDTRIKIPTGRVLIKGSLAMINFCDKNNSFNLAFSCLRL